MSADSGGTRSPPDAAAAETIRHSEGQSAGALSADRRSDVGALIRSGAQPLSSFEQRAGWFRLKKALGERRGPGWGRGARRRDVVAIGGAVVVMGALALGARPFWRAHRDGELTALMVSSERGTIQPGSIVPSGPEGTRLAFSDGSRVSLPARARARLVSVGPHGAHIALADGQMDADVAHRPNANWDFAAGPFSIHVVGTSFSLEWSEANERLYLVMRQGVVTVGGPLVSEIMSVRAGEALTVSVRDHRVLVERPTTASTPPDDADRSGISPSSPKETPSDESLAGVATHPALDRGRGDGRASATRSTWRRLVAAGRSAEVVADAERRGLDVVLATADRRELTALADAARYSRRNEVAQRALYALRDRFPDFESARDAAFFLGRIEDARRSRAPNALEWYRRYRAEAPNGLYLEEAVGREMLLMRELYGLEAARTVARTYLARFPRSQFARDATQIMGP
jgi:FecR protein